MTDNEITTNIKNLTEKLNEVIAEHNKHVLNMRNLAGDLVWAFSGIKTLLDMPIIDWNQRIYDVQRADQEAQAREDRGSKIPFTPLPKGE